MADNITVPESFQPFLWSVDVKKIDINAQKRYIIHQLLHYGDIDAFHWLEDTYSLSTLQDVFVHHPEKMYTEKSFAFVQKFLLHLNGEKIEKERYVSVVS